MKSTLWNNFQRCRVSLEAWEFFERSSLTLRMGRKNVTFLDAILLARFFRLPSFSIIKSRKMKNSRIWSISRNNSDKTWEKCTVTQQCTFFAFSHISQNLTPTLTERICQSLFVWVIMNMSHLRYRKKVFQNFRKFISQEWRIKILIRSVYCLLLNSSFKLLLGRNYNFKFSISTAWELTLIFFGFPGFR